MNIADQTKHTLDVAFNKTFQEPVGQINEDDTTGQISAGAASISKIFGSPYHPTVQDPNAGSIYIGKAQGKLYHIIKKAEDTWQVAHPAANGAMIEIAKYPTFNGALMMLQSRLPGLVQIKNELEVVSTPKQEPEDVVSLNALHEDTARCEDWKDRIRTKYPEHAEKIKFVNRVDTPHLISAEVPGYDRTFGVYDIKSGHNEILESVQCDLKKGDRVCTIKQGQQEGTVEKIEEENGMTRVYHRHANGKLYASAPSNLRKIDDQVNEGTADDDAMHKKMAFADYGDFTESDPSEEAERLYPALARKGTLMNHLDAAFKKHHGVDFYQYHANVWHEHKLDKACDAHCQNGGTYKDWDSDAAAKQLNSQNPWGKYQAPTKVNESVKYILEQIGVASLDDLTEETRKELLAVAAMAAPHI